MRCFIAIDISNDILNKIYELVNTCKNIDKNLKYVNKENLHITLKFLGEIKENDIKTIIENLKEIKLKKFKLKIIGTGGFPDLNSPKVLWIGVENNTNINNLFLEINNKLNKFDFYNNDDKEFNPHLTIARIKQNIKKEIIEFIKNSSNKDFGELEVNKFSLFKSDLTPQGPIYTKLHDFYLN